MAVHVSDTGVGIPQTAMSRVFDEFFQVAGSTSSGRRDGAGLGLTITRRLVRIMGGELSVQSAPGVGSCFTFTLPLAESLPSMKEAKEAKQGREARGDSGGDAHGNGPRGLLNGQPERTAGAGRSRAQRFQDELHGTNTAG